MKKLLFIALAFAGLQGTAQVTTIIDPDAKPRNVTTAFQAVSVMTGIELFLTQANETALAVSVSDTKFEEGLKTEVVNGTLKIYYDGKNNKWEKGRKIKAYLSVASLNKMYASSGATIKIINAFSAGSLAIHLSSGSQMDGEIKAMALDVDQSSGSESRLSGSATAISIQASSGASFRGFDLVTESCEANASSGAEIKITSNKEISAAASSGASIQYKGSAATKDINKSSGGSVKKA